MVGGSDARGSDSGSAAPVMPVRLLGWNGGTAHQFLAVRPNLKNIYKYQVYFQFFSFGCVVAMSTDTRAQEACPTRPRTSDMGVLGALAHRYTGEGPALGVRDRVNCRRVVLVPIYGIIRRGPRECASAAVSCGASCDHPAQHPDRNPGFRFPLIAELIPRREMHAPHAVALWHSRQATSWQVRQERC